MTTKIWKVGVVGYGLSAEIFHIPFINALPEYTLHAIVQRSPEVGNNAAEEQPHAKCFLSLEGMLENTMVDLVVISTPTESHYSLTKSAFCAQKHVLCEKPFTQTAKEADELIAMASEQQRVLAVFHNRRWDSDFVTLSQLVNTGALGQVTHFDTRFELFQPKSRIDQSLTVAKATLQIKAIYDLGTHLLDQGVQLFGLPERVTVKLHYHNGMLVTARAVRIHSDEPPLRFSVKGDKGSFKKLYIDIQKDHLVAGKSPIDEGFGEEPQERYGVLATKQSDGSVIEKVIIPVQHPTRAEYYRKLASAMDGQGPVPVSGSEASDIIQIVEMAVLISQSGESKDFPS
ncbi:NAD binding Rossmann fold oxidoreductase [Penicillium malachiteum]|nr:NAD binding Rossmann fold oxidoreductase [Penicillium malachiteum]